MQYIVYQTRCIDLSKGFTQHIELISMRYAVGMTLLRGIKYVYIYIMCIIYIIHII